MGEYEGTIFLPYRMSHFSKHAQRAAEKMFGNIILGDLLGQGGFGRVYKGEACRTGIVSVDILSGCTAG